ncbi:hypothetical protein [Bifidobacterium leontopitheci]|nr:hypothetical protein [Bifidobacterium leontopitheci]
MAEGTDEERLTFFRIVSSLFALEEHSPQIPGYEGDRSTLASRLRDLACTDSLLDDLRAAIDSIFVVDGSRSGEELFLMKLSREDQYLDIESFSVERLDEALRRYDAVERHAERTSVGDDSAEDFVYDNAVLVFASDQVKLSVAYPNYSTNVRFFLDKVTAYLK